MRKPEGAYTSTARTEQEGRGAGAWVTPLLSSGLLPGVMRAELLSTGEVQEGTVSVEELCVAARRGPGWVRCFNSVR